MAWSQVNLLKVNLSWSTPVGVWPNLQLYIA
jgi:hypothetical protein